MLTLKVCLKIRNVITLNGFVSRSVASEIKFKLIDPEPSSGTLNDGKFLSQLNNYLASSGITQPEKQIYVEAKPGPRLAELIFLIILSTLSKLTYSHNAGKKDIYLIVKFFAQN